ncbi:hypothetical protein SLE2022_226430 [Rubroshorea leprosula]
MATVPVKSHPLHNFSFSLLKWGKHGTATDQRRGSPELESDSEPPRHTRVGSRSARVQRVSFTTKPIGQHRQQQQEDGSVQLEEETQLKNPRQEEAVLPARQRKQAVGDVKEGNEAGEEEEEHEEEETAKRPWNLRPRKAETMVTVAVEKQSEIAVTAPKSMRLRGLAENGAGVGEKKEKRKFWIALSREEIEEDVYAMTGSRPARRPKKRPKNVQKQLDSVFPGLWLVGTSADAYRVADSLVKK